MSSSVETYDISTAEVGNALATTINATSRPNTTHVERKIKGVCGTVNTELERLNVDPSSITEANDANTYHKIRDYVIDELVADWHSTNQRDDTDYASSRHDRWVSFKIELQERFTAALGNSSPTTAESDVLESSLETISRDWSDWSFS